MDQESFDQMCARLTALVGAETHPQVPCAGLVPLKGEVSCPECIAYYRAVVGDERPTCMVCLGQHFAYEPHRAPDAGATVELGVKLANAQPWRWDSGLPVLIRLTGGEGDQ